MDQAEFAELVEPYRRELRVHCYRMTGSLDEADDLVQETLLRAWRGIGGLAARGTVRAWLYRIATNACLDALAGRGRRALPYDVEAVSWLQPFPGPEDLTIERETIELAFLVALQHLPPRQRATLILRDVLSFPAAQTAELLEASVPATNSALQRARATLRERDVRRITPPTAEERSVVRRYVDALERADVGEVAELLAADVRATMPPWREWFADRAGVLRALTISWDPASPDYVGRFRALPVRVNGGPGVAGWTRRGDEPEFTAFAVVALRIAGGRVAEMTAFHEPRLFPAFGLPMSLPAGDRLIR